jgi:uncharacterized protein (TIGR02117 family)
MIRAVCLLAFACLSACAVRPTAPDTPLADAIVYVIGRGWHTDIGLPVTEIDGPLAQLEQGFPGVQYMTFGFGERQFLLTRKPTPLTMLSAMLPSRSALLMTALRDTPQNAFGPSKVVVLHVTAEGLRQIQARVWQELERSASGEPILLADGPYPGSVFYAARETYSGLFTCNTWTAETMRAGGLPMPATGVLFASQVMAMARWIGARQASSGD